MLVLALCPLLAAGYVALAAYVSRRT